MRHKIGENMKKILVTCLIFANYALQALPWDAEYEKILLQRAGEKLPELVTYPFFQYPNQEHAETVKYFPNGKVLIFGYGSLMNKTSASRSLKPEAVATIQPAFAFGVKRLFNYVMANTERYGETNRKEKAMLNMTQTLNLKSIANGVTIEVDSEDLAKLVERETGYDLVPILVTSWDEAVEQNPEPNIRIAYAFVAVHELRDHIDYTSTEFYPVRGYLNMIQEASLAYGEDFARIWNETTYLADGTTPVETWDKSTFLGILCTDNPINLKTSVGSGK